MKINLRAYEAYILKRSLDNLENDFVKTYEGSIVHRQTYHNKKNANVSIVYLKERLSEVVKTELDNSFGANLKDILERIKGFRALMTKLNKEKEE